ncbi:MAG: hypothetical protein AB7U23_16590 [Dehalococcoidia bacterium]
MAKRSKAGTRNWTEAEARGVLAACEASGLSMRAYAKLRGLRERRLYWWTQRLADGGPIRDASMARFVPAVVRVDATRAGASATITIRVGSKATMEIAEPASVSAGWVAELMTELERLSCS